MRSPAPSPSAPWPPKACTAPSSAPTASASVRRAPRRAHRPVGGDPSGIRVTEVAPWGSGNGPYAADWVEVTNTGTESVNLTGWRLDDSSACSRPARAGRGADPARWRSAIFFEGSDDAAFELAFAQAWFGQNLFDAGFFFGHYTGGGAGLSTGGDAVTLFDSEGTLITGVSFGASPPPAPFATFDNAAGLGTAAAPFPIPDDAQLHRDQRRLPRGRRPRRSVPRYGEAAPPSPLPPRPSVAITEVTPWGPATHRTPRTGSS